MTVPTHMLPELNEILQEFGTWCPWLNIIVITAGLQLISGYPQCSGCQERQAVSQTPLTPSPAWQIPLLPSPPQPTPLTLQGQSNAPYKHPGEKEKSTTL